MVEKTPFRFAFSATFTAEPLQPIIAFWGRRLNSEFETRFAPYNQMLQSLVDPASEFAANTHGVNVLLARIEDLGDPARIEENLQHLVGVLRESPARISVPIIFVLCPSAPTFQADSKLAAKLAAGLDEVPGVQFIGHEQIEHLYPVAEPHSIEGERLGRIPYTDLYFCALGTAIVRHAHALVRPPSKVIALDCDNTLWQGICGEDGPQGIVLDPPRRALQEFMAAQREDGTLLVLASKNNEQDVVETFEHNPEMPLQLRHFVAWRLNWESKAANLAALANELSLGLDSFVFVDDNPKECAEVEESVPEVLTLALPENPAEIPHCLEHVWAFDHAIVTEEDRNRNAYYAQSQEFGREMKRTASLEEFMRSLDLKLRIEPLTAEHLPRVSQLTQRTNQFNFTTIRRSEAEIKALVENEHAECFTIEASDRFGDYGLVGVVIFRVAENTLDIDTLLLSCRALGRGVEHRILSNLGQEALRRGCSTVVARIHVTKRNQPAQQFLQEISEHPGEVTESGFIYRLDAVHLSGLEWKPSQPIENRAIQRVVVSKTRKFVDFASIAKHLSTPTQILEAMRSEFAGIAAVSMTDTEARLASIWSELLQQPSIPVTANFFDLGGHSLLAVLLVLRVRETFGVELPIDDVYSASLTLSELARKIELYQMGGLNPNEYESLLEEIEGLSDEEVQRLLAEEDPGALRS
jgi:FkbH-like protein